MPTFNTIMESSFLPNTTPSIPNVLHITWVQGERAMPDRIRFNLSTWARHNPDMKILIHDDESIRALLAEWPTLLQRYLEAPFFAVKKDISQFAIVYKHGGLFVDADFQCQKSVQSLLQNNSFLTVNWEADEGLKARKIVPALNVIGAVAGHPILLRVMDGFAKNKYLKGAPMTYIEQNAKVWTKAVREGWKELAGTDWQFFVQPSWSFGMDNPRKYTNPIERPNPEAYAFPVGHWGSWHNPVVKAYHACVAFCNDNAKGLAFAGTVLLTIFIIVSIVLLSVLVWRTRQKTKP